MQSRIDPDMLRSRDLKCLKKRSPVMKLADGFSLLKNNI
jgi:hypothetical protein